MRLIQLLITTENSVDLYQLQCFPEIMTYICYVCTRWMDFMPHVLLIFAYINHGRLRGQFHSPHPSIPLFAHPTRLLSYRLSGRV
jgi:uncharacterized membrane protein